MPPHRPRPFLTANWESLLLINFECPPELLEPLVPVGTELESWQGVHVVSLVGFRFVKTRVLGVPIPGHRAFTEVNLRFYVRVFTPAGDVRRGVVFVRELVPRRAVAAVARLVYNEPYLALPMSHDVALDPERGGAIEYAWRHRGRHHRLRALVSGVAEEPLSGSEGSYVTEHYWGYTAQRDGGTLEYEVEHPTWRIWPAGSARYEAPGGDALYGPDFTRVLAGAPRSAFVAVGSKVAVYPGRRLEEAGP